jgi:hypothetical protein
MLYQRSLDIERRLQNVLKLRPWNVFLSTAWSARSLFAKYMNDPDFKKLVSEHLLRQVYDQIREEGAP